MTERARRILDRCRRVAQCTEVAGETTRLALSPVVHDVHTHLRGWMEAAGMSVRIDAAGNLRGVYAGETEGAPRLLIGSHLDTVPNAGAFDGVLGVVLGVSVVEEMQGRRLPFAIEVIGFAEEEGVRFGKPFLGSLALVGELDQAALARVDRAGTSVAESIHAFGLNTAALSDALLVEGSFAYLEVHIEQGPVLESEGRSLGVIEAIAGQTRVALVFTGQANHAGTTPMLLRHDALAAAAEWMVAVERYARRYDGLVATVGRLETRPSAANVIPGEVSASLDVRHGSHAVRTAAVRAMLVAARDAAEARGVGLTTTLLYEQATVGMDSKLVDDLLAAASRAGHEAGRMTSGAGHDAMILASHLPSVMLFLRTPGGLSHHPAESVLAEDVEAALATVLELCQTLSR